MTKQKPYHIHFVCRGNTYRSRLAAAYMATLLDEKYVVSSSGIGTQLAKVHTSEGYTQALAKLHGLDFGIHMQKTQTTNELLAAADIIVFMNKDVYDEAQTRFQIDARKTLIWQVPDIRNDVRRRYDESRDVGVVLAIAERTFQKIRRHCDELRAYVTAGSWVEVADKQDRLTSLRLPIDWVTDRGFWHRGVHVVVQTADHKFVVGKRDKAMVFAPDMLEITLGGLIDSGESPLQAAVRETHEEIGIALPTKKFRPLFRYQQVGYHPHTRKQTRVHLYVYAVTVPVHSSRLVPQPGEVTELRVLSRRQVKHLLQTHRMQHFGRLKWGYQLYSKAVAYSTLPL